MNFLDIDLLSTGSHLIAKLELLILETRGMTRYSNFQGWRSWKWRFTSIAEGWVFNHWMTSLDYIGDTVMSWQHWPKTEVKVWWTIGMNELSRRLPNPNSHDDGVKCHVQERPATVKSSVHFPNFSSVICRPVPLFFFFLTSLRRITYSWSIIQPFGKIMYCYLII